MAKREWTDEQRKAFGEKMKRARQNKNSKATLSSEVSKEATEVDLTPTAPEPKEHEPVDVDPAPEEPTPRETISVADYNKLQQEIHELKSIMFDGMVKNNNQASEPGVSVSNGKLVGTTDRYTVDSAYYPDPRDRLRQEDKLRQFAFDINYDLNWEVNDVSYTTIDNIRYREPKFTLELVRVLLDEETGERTAGRYIICRLIMHEDPDAAIAIARQEGLDVNTDNEKEFLDEMRYIRARDWLFECFFPPKAKSKSERKDMVIGNKLVQYYEVNNEEGQGTPRFDFGKLEKKL